MGRKLCAHIQVRWQIGAYVICQRSVLVVEVVVSQDKGSTYESEQMVKMAMRLDEEDLKLVSLGCRVNMRITRSTLTLCDEGTTLASSWAVAWSSSAYPVHQRGQ